VAPAPAPATDAPPTDGKDTHGPGGGSTSAASFGNTADSSDGTARALGIAGIAVGALGVAFGVFAGRRRDPSGSRPSDLPGPSA
jgi:hypothetical protein